jgi:DNA invertase Pin-like site-specific DNA recombinase
MITAQEISTLKDIGFALAVISLGFLQQWNARKQTAKQDKLAVVADDIHTLSNHNMEVQLLGAVDQAETNLIQARIIAGLRTDPTDADLIKRAERRLEKAQQDYAEHLKKQALVDASKTPKAPK